MTWVDDWLWHSKRLKQAYHVSLGAIRAWKDPDSDRWGVRIQNNQFIYVKNPQNILPWAASILLAAAEQAAYEWGLDYQDLGTGFPLGSPYGGGGWVTRMRWASEQAVLIASSIEDDWFEEARRAANKILSVVGQKNKLESEQKRRYGFDYRF